MTRKLFAAFAAIALLGYSSLSFSLTQPLDLGEQVITATCAELSFNRIASSMVVPGEIERKKLYVGTAAVSFTGLSVWAIQHDEAGA